MSSRRIDSASPAAREHWRLLAEQSAWDVIVAARLLGVSLRRLERQCQRELDCTPTEWMQRERMAAAARLLAAGQPVKVVAMTLGYTRPANFSRDFKRHHGRTPRTFAPHSLFGLPFTSPVLKEGESEKNAINSIKVA